MTNGFQDTDLAATFKHGEGDGVGDDDEACDHGQRGDGCEHDNEVVEDLIDDGVDIYNAENDG